MAIWIIITTSLINGSKEFGKDYETRKKEYILGIKSIVNRVNYKYKILIVENNSIIDKENRLLHRTFLDYFGVPVYYTTTNQYVTKNYGRTELIDILKCIYKYNIQDDDFIVKVTGRYILDNDCTFFNVIENKSYSAVVRFGAYYSNDFSRETCVTGLIGLKAKYVKSIEMPDDDTFVENKWANQIASLPSNEVCELSNLGIYIRPSIENGYIKV